MDCADKDHRHTLTTVCKAAAAVCATPKTNAMSFFIQQKKHMYKLAARKPKHTMYI